MRVQNAYTEESLEFMKRLLATSGVGPKTAWPPSMTRCLEGHPHDDTAEAAREESKVSYLLIYFFINLFIIS